jgi:hypothetical protein
MPNKKKRIQLFQPRRTSQKEGLCGKGKDTFFRLRQGSLCLPSKAIGMAVFQERVVGSLCTKEECGSALYASLTHLSAKFITITLYYCFSKKKGGDPNPYDAFCVAFAKGIKRTPS